MKITPLCTCSDFNKNSVKEALKDTESAPKIKIPGAKLILTK